MPAAKKSGKWGPYYESDEEEIESEWYISPDVDHPRELKNLIVDDRILSPSEKVCS